MSWRRRYYRSSRGRREDSCPIRRPYVAIVAEKPKAAEKIALALGRPVKCRYLGIPYWVLSDNGKTVLVVPSAGHLFGPHSDKHGFPVYELEWRPLHEFDRNARHTRKFYLLMKRLLPGASLYINACDYDIEGSVIGYTIIEAFGDVSRYRRMKFSSLSPVELRRAYSRLEGPDILLVEAGKARHEVDWIWGINVSRALMHAARVATGRRIILSAGRVQSPTIVEASRRWKEINLAVPTPVFNIRVEARSNGSTITLSPHGWKPETRAEAERIVAFLRRNPRMRVVSSTRSTSRMRPPPAFNLGDLQKEAARLYGFSPMKTQSIAEDLYLEALISYPRTNSQKLPPTIDYGSIIRSLTRGPRPLGGLASRLLQETRGVLKPVQGAKDDPAHPAIHPTGETPRSELDRDHWRIYELIVRRFLAAFSSEAVVARVVIVARDGGGRDYIARGASVLREGWMYYYPYLRPEEAPVPPLARGSILLVEKASMQTSWERKAPKLSKTSLLAWMESQGIGTEATRARIIEILFKRGYLESRGGKTVVTDLGMIVSEIIEALFPDLSRPELTRRLEAMLEDVRSGRRTRRQVVEENIRILDGLLREYRKRLESVGDSIAYSLGLKEPPVRCEICGRQAVTRGRPLLCRYHFMAYERLRSSLDIVSRRLGVSRGEALRRIAGLRGAAGRWVIEVARYLLEEGLESLV